MDMSGQQLIKASPEAVWEGLNDADVLRQCITGCEELSVTGKDAFEAVVTAKVGPVKATFKGAVQLSEIDRPNSYVISGEGKGGPAGFAKGGARVTLTPEGSSTILKYTVEAKVGGKLAQIGSKLVDMAARKMAQDFFENFCAVVEQRSSESEERELPVASDVATKSGPLGIPTWGWLVAAAIFFGLAYVLI